MNKRQKGNLPRDEPAGAPLRSWHAPEFYQMDVNSTEIGKTGHIDNPGQPTPQHS